MLVKLLIKNYIYLPFYYIMLVLHLFILLYVKDTVESKIADN